MLVHLCFGFVPGCPTKTSQLTKLAKVYPRLVQSGVGKWGVWYSVVCGATLGGVRGAIRPILWVPWTSRLVLVGIMVWLGLGGYSPLWHRYRYRSKRYQCRV